MTTLSDLLQIILSQPDPERWLFVAAALSLLLLVLRIFGKGLGIVGQVAGWLWAKSPLNMARGGQSYISILWVIKIPVSWEWAWSVAKLFAYSGAVICFAPQIHDGLQRWKQTAHPAYVIQHDDPTVAYCYEKEIDRHLTLAEASFFRQRIAEIAAKIGSTPLALMEVGFSECGLNPFAFNIDPKTGDTLAAGFIQFTPTGLEPCYLGGQKVTYRQVKGWCRARNLERIMACTEVYFDAFARGRALPRPVDIYLCVFAPKFIGCGPEQTMYDKWNTPKQYYGGGNEYFDGYFVETRNGKPLILRLDSAMDGRITVGELALHLEKKKARLVGGGLR